MNVRFSDEVKEKIFEQAHGSIAVVQEIIKKLCEKSDLLETHPGTTPYEINDLGKR